MLSSVRIQCETGENTDNTSDMISSGDDETVEHELQCLLNVEM